MATEKERIALFYNWEKNRKVCMGATEVYNYRETYMEYLEHKVIELRKEIIELRKKPTQDNRYNGI